MVLNNLHFEMLRAGKFYLDGWTSGRGRRSAAELEGIGYLESFVNRGSQYTAITYTITDAGCAALAGTK